MGKDTQYSERSKGGSGAMTEPVVSVIIPTYNSGKYIEQCLESVLAQTYQNWEVWIVYSPSTDDTFSKMYWYLHYPNVHIKIVPKSNCATARNAGIEQAQGKYIAMLDADDWWEKDKLKRLVTEMEQNPNLVYCAHHSVLHFKDRVVYDYVYAGKSYAVGGVGTSLIRKEFLIGLEKNRGFIFDESMNRADDADLMLCIRNEPSSLIPAWLSHYRIHDEGLESQTSDYERYTTLFKSCLKYGAYDILVYHLYELSLVQINKLFGCDIVRWKKDVFG
jgi:glycosyltransferase involved in cell wall biosynthesis